MNGPSYISHRREMLYDLLLDYLDDKGFEAVDIYDEMNRILKEEEEYIEGRLDKVRQLRGLMGF